MIPRSRAAARLVATVLLLAAATAARADPKVVALRWQGAIGPLSASYLERGLKLAAGEEANLLVLQLDTPGGLDSSMRSMVQDILASPTPVAVYVAPDGARAASAGVFVMTAAQIAAMAPATNTGAAHPVGLGGKMDATMTEKVTNDAVAYLKSLAARRGRSTDWCDAVVRSSASVPADSALAMGMIDVVVPDLDALLEWCDGREVSVGGQTRTLDTSGAWVIESPPDWRERFLRAITDPNMAYIFLMLGVYGLFFELSRPGAILPGVVGGISLLLAILAFQGLPVNYVGVLLILLGAMMLVLEAHVSSYGALAVGGTVSIVLGSLLLFRSAAPLGSLSLKVLVPIVGFGVLLFVGIVGMGLRAQKRPVVTGPDALVGQRGSVVRIEIDAGEGTRGTVLVFGEYWTFTCAQSLRPGDGIVVVGREEGRLRVEPADTNGG